MNPIDWDRVARLAEIAPRQVLSEIVEDVDQIELLCVAYTMKDGSIGVGWASADGSHSSMTGIGLLETAKAALMRMQETA